jgi:NAD(P)-dependent dehydrogenase (short-subunit alcohol dehydrogenase family)
MQVANTVMFPAQGANVTVHGKSNIEPIRDLMEKFGKDRVHCVMADLSDEEKVEQIFFCSHVQFGPVQVLVVNHGIWAEQHVPLADMTLDQWNMTIQMNLTSSFLVCREYLKGLAGETATDKLKEKASIVLIGSTSGKFGEAGHADYAASKSGMSISPF